MIVLTEKGTSLTSPAGIKLNALNPDTLKYLGGHVGKVIEAKVVQVVSELTANTGADKASTKHIQNKNLPNKSSAQSTPLNNPKSEQTNLSGNTHRRETPFQVVLEIGTQRISVKSPLAPRIGQLLQLEVINFKTLSIIEANPRAHAGTTHTAARLNTSVPLTPLAPQTTATTKQLTNIDTLGSQIARVQKALRQSLPKQLARSELRSALDSLAKQQPSLAAAKPNTSITTALPNTASNSVPAGGTAPPSTNGNLSSTNSTAVQQPNVNIKPAPTVNAKSKTTSNLIQNSAANIPASIKLPLQQFKDSIPALEQLIKPDGVKQALLNSGLFFEKKLTQLLPQSRPLIQQAAQQTTQLTTQLTTAKKSHPTPTELGKIAGNENFSKTDTPLNKTEASKHLKGDLKYQMASVAGAIKSHLAKSTSSSSTASRSQQLTETLPQHLQTNSTLALLWQLENSPPIQRSKNTAAETDSNDTVMQLLRLALGSLARTQSQQLQSIGSQLAANSDTVSNQLLNAELPFWHDARLNIIDIKIDREKTDKQKTEKPNAWNVRLRFDLEELGELTALATLQGKTMAAVFWASGKTLADKIGRELESLSQNLIELGLEVKQLHCSVGEPSGHSSELPVNLLNTSLLQEKT